MLTVTVYSTGPSCARCTLTKRVLDQKGVPYVEVDIRENPDARAYVVEDLGYSEAPVCVVEDGSGEDHWSGFRPDQIDRVAAHQG
ncbi:glutaredoxin family protein [Microbacterium sp. NPDC055683]